MEVRVALKGSTLRVVKRAAQKQAETLKQEVPLDAMLQAIVEQWVANRSPSHMPQTKKVIKKVVDNIQHPIT